MAKANPAKSKSPAPESAAAGDPGATPLGARIRRLRQDRRWSLGELSKRCGIAGSTLSKIENGLLSLAYDRLLAVAQAFDMGLSDFLAFSADDTPAPSATARISWALRGGGEVLKIGSYTYEYLCTSLRAKKLVPLIGQVHARSLSQFGPLLKHEGEEFLLVLKGEVQVHSEFYEPQILREWEGVYLDSRMGHAAINVGSGEAWILSVNTDPIRPPPGEPPPKAARVQPAVGRAKPAVKDASSRHRSRAG
jgi:transcriptional regulator with XRE-family HTH domain